MQFTDGKRYRDYSSFIRNHFNNRVQKISLNAGFTCPNLDGTKGRGGCTYCNNNTFNPKYCKPVKPITQQLDEGIAFFAEKYKTQEYLAYFQAFTNTYAETRKLEEMYLEALAHPRVTGLVISTRPDCIPDETLDLLEKLAKDRFISLDFGIESTLNRTLDAINRCHTHEETIDAFARARNRGLHLGGHMILGLPGESRQELLDHAARINELPLDSLKIHHLQIVKHTMMAHQYKQDPGLFKLFTVEEYVDLITEFIGLLRPEIILDRFISQSPTHLLIAPNWNGLKNFEIIARIDKKLEEKDYYQGCLL
jgi:radical SAM protein (TIGR01212 family)